MAFNARETIQLLKEPVRDASGYCCYDERHAARPDPSCAQVNELLDDHLALVRQRLAMLQALEQQLVALRRSCEGDASHACAILESFKSAAQHDAGAGRPGRQSATSR